MVANIGIIDFNPVGNRRIRPGRTLSFTLFGTDPEGAAVSYYAGNLPDGAAFDTETGDFSWTPTSAQSGAHTDLLFAVSDGVRFDYEFVAVTVDDSRKDFLDRFPIAARPFERIDSQPATFWATCRITYDLHPVFAGPSNGAEFYRSAEVADDLAAWRIKHRSVPQHIIEHLVWIHQPERVSAIVAIDADPKDEFIRLIQASPQISLKMIAGLAGFAGGARRIG